MKQETLLALALGVLIGFFVGFFAGMRYEEQRYDYRSLL